METNKFRVWDTYCEYMEYPSKKTELVAGLVLGLDGRVLSPLCNARGISQLFDYKDDFVVMQFIGRKDKNGKEIYKSDICKNGDREESAKAYNYRIEEVVWDNDNACWLGWNHNEDGMTCEVIGNIYENPELLKSKKNDQNI